MERIMKERIDDLGIGGLQIIQNSDYFCFGTDSVLLANFVESNSSQNVVLDVCSGSGVIPLILSAKKKYRKIFGVELQPEMYQLLQRNITYNKLEDRIVGIQEDVKNVSNIRKRILQEMGSDKLDIMVANPPYKTVGTGIGNTHDVKYIARHEVTCCLEDIFRSADALLKYKGKLYLVHKPERLVDLMAVARKYQLEPKRLQLVYPTIHARPSIVLVEYIKQGGNELTILEPLIEYDAQGNYTEQFLKIYGYQAKEEETHG